MRLALCAAVAWIAGVVLAATGAIAGGLIGAVHAALAGVGAGGSRYLK
jgi:hypothetical protein